MPENQSSDRESQEEGIEEITNFGVFPARFNKTLAPQSMSRVVRRLGLLRQKARPVHPRRDEEAVEAFKRRGSCKP